MYSTKSGLILGFHGCDQSIVDNIFSQKTKNLQPSRNEWDWLGHGIYFWENSPSRAHEFAKSKPQNSAIKNPAVIGAVIDLGYCLDLLDYSNLAIVKESYKTLQEVFEQNESALPENLAPGKSKDLLVRKLDCLVIQSLHQTKEDRGEVPYDSVRGLFDEGRELYPNAGFKEKNHIQICIRNPNCIKGFFLPRNLDNDWNKV